MVKNLPANVGDTGDSGSIPGSGKETLEEEMAPVLVFLPMKLHGPRSLAGYIPWDRKESDKV